MGSAGTSPIGNRSTGRSQMSPYRKLQLLHVLVATAFYIVSLVLILLGR